jgi:hypothetical protein
MTSAREALASPYVAASSRFAYSDLLRGDTRRALRTLQGGPAAAALVATAEPLVRGGRMTLEQFRQHVAELCAEGRTLVHDPGDQARTAALVENLAAQQRLARTAEQGLPVDPDEANRLVAEREWLLSVETGMPAYTRIDGHVLASLTAPEPRVEARPRLLARLRGTAKAA